MPHLRFERHAPYPPEDMMALVADVEAYPDFVPNCSKMDVRRDRTNPDDDYRARMHIRFGPIAQAYTSEVHVDREARTIAARAVDGPFSYLRSTWHFDPEEGGTKIVFEIDFGFSNPLVARMAEPAFAAKQREIVDAFMDRAGEVHKAS